MARADPRVGGARPRRDFRRARRFWYAEHRDVVRLPGAELVLYDDWALVSAERRRLLDFDVVIVTSYCPDAVAATRLAEDDSRATRIFYDLDTPVTLARIDAGEAVDYLPAEGLTGYDLVLSYTGGAALTSLRARLGARKTAPLYGHVDPEAHRPVAADATFAGDLSYLGTHAADRQQALDELFVAPAKAMPEARFVLGGSGYPADFPWRPNIWFMDHVAPPDHPAFFASSRLTLNVTRGDMAAMGWCPSGRLFEAAACGAAIVSDRWDGLDAFFVPGEEIIVAETRADVLTALALDLGDVRRIATRARERVLAEHSSSARVQPRPAGLCDAIFRACPLITPDDQVLIGLPDTIWFPADALRQLPDDRLSFLLFPVDNPSLFDAVVTDAAGNVEEIEVKVPAPRSRWVWGAFKMPGLVLHELAALWREAGRDDEYFGTLVNAWLARGNVARGVRAGESYVDVGTLGGYRSAIALLAGP